MLGWNSERWQIDFFCLVGRALVKPGDTGRSSLLEDVATGVDTTLLIVEWWLRGDGSDSGGIDLLCSSADNAEIFCA